MDQDEIIAQYLMEHNLVTKQVIDATKKEIKITDKPLGVTLVRNGFISSRLLTELSLKLHPEELGDSEFFEPRIPVDLLLETRTKLVAQNISSVYIATIDDEDAVLEDIQQYFPNRKIIFVEADAEQIDQYLDKLELRNNIEDTVLDEVISEGIRMGASDIHINPRRNSYTVFYRRYGVRNIAREGELDEYLALSSRIKDKSSMDQAERRVPQDGGFSYEFDGRVIDLRVATSPSKEGETIVIRILDPDKSDRKLADLGISNLEAWQTGATLLHGLNLVVGATGSGKTTTLNATMKELNRFEKAIFTAEDPVEYSIPYVSQVNINEQVGLTFGRALKAFLRQDPDIIMIGEVRDEETSKLLIKAAETGHLVFSTLHTGSIQGAISRLRDIGVPSHQLKHVLKSVLAQNLIRTLCRVCHRTDPACFECSGTGYSGQTIVSEAHYFKNADEVEEIIKNPSGDKPWVTMIEDAYTKYLQGITDSTEIIRVFGQDAIEIIEKRGKAEWESK